MVKLENIKVAVRVRPFAGCGKNGIKISQNIDFLNKYLNMIKNTREKTKGCGRMVSMIDNVTFVHDPCELVLPRQFTFDHSYWSHDGFDITEDGYLRPAEGSKYADQKQLFSNLGVGLLENAWSGYNCTMFAYGQTGSGKTYSMLGHGSNKGMVPMLCEKLFDDIASKGRQAGVIYQVSFCMFEIYNERVFDLLRKDGPSQQNLPVRLTAKHGFCVDGLLTYPVSSYRDVEHYIDECNKNRTVAVTKMNENSSRAHTIVTISFLQNCLKENRMKMSKINLVDLAGSERASQTGATGVRFEESKHINQSLMTLGIVIKNLCAMACGRTDQGPTPYRDSKLTMLLKDAVGGNCKTIMVATISPSDQDYEQTLSTLRYADRVKSIRNKIIANVTQTDQYIQELLEEKETLLAKLNGRRTSLIGYSEEEIKQLKDKQISEIQQIKIQMVNVEKAWQTKLQETKKIMEEQLAKVRKLEKDKAETPHLWNLNEDPALTGKIVHFIRPGQITTVGNIRALVPPIIDLHGPSIAREHAVIQNKNTLITIMPLKGQLRINGVIVSEQTALKHQDRIFFSANNIFVFHNPSEEKQMRKAGKEIKHVTFEMAQTEIGEHSHVDSGGLGWLKEEIAETLILSNEANAISFELERGIRFEPIIVPGLVLGDKAKRSKVFVRVNTPEGGEFLWGKNHFQDRFDLMMEVFRKHETETHWEPKTKTQDPFWEPLETPTLVGVAFVPLESIAYMLDIEEQVIGIYDYQARHVGHLSVLLVPCSADGDEMSDEVAVEEPKDLLNSDMIFKVKIKGAIGIPRRFKSTWCRYTFHMETERVYTDEVQDVVPKYNFEHMHHLKKVSQTTLEYLEEGSLMIELYGRQRKTDDRRRGSTTDAFTIADRRRISAANSLSGNSGLYPLRTSACGSHASQSISGILLEDETESEDDTYRNDETEGRDTNCSKMVESNYTSAKPMTHANSRETSQLQMPDLLIDSSRNSLEGFSTSLKEVRKGIASVMEEVIKRDGLSNTFN